MMHKLIFPLAALILLSACIGTRLQKRRYTKGYYFSAGKHALKKHGEAAALTHDHTPQKTTPQQAHGTTQVTAQPMPVTFKQPENTVSIDKRDHIRSAVNHTAALTAAAKTSPAVAPAKTFKAVIAAMKMQQKRPRGDAETNTVLLVILSIFPILALLAMYLHDGHKITINFWVDLVLHLTFIGYAIYAVLVSLGIVDLSK